MKATEIPTRNWKVERREAFTGKKPHESIKESKYFYVPADLDVAARVRATGERNLTKPIHLDKFYYVIDNIYLRTVIRRCGWEQYLGLHSRILIKILTSRFASRIKKLLVVVGVLEEKPNYKYRNNHSASQYRFTSEFRNARFRRVPMTDLKLQERLLKAQKASRTIAIGIHPGKSLIQKSIEALTFDEAAALEFVRRNEYKTNREKEARFVFIEMAARRRGNFFTTDGAGRFYHVLTHVPRELRQFFSWKNQPLFAIDASNCQPALHSTLYKEDSPEKGRYIELVSSNNFYSFINQRLPKPFKLPQEKGLLKNDVFHYIFYGSAYAKESNMLRAFRQEFPILAGLINNAKRYNNTDLPVHFQRIEADIVLNKVATPFALNHREQDCCLISIHDALVTTKGQVEEVRFLMDGCFAAFLGYSLEVKVTQMTRKM